jgi:3-oxoadipate enol-lactonase
VAGERVSGAPLLHCSLAGPDDAPAIVLLHSIATSSAMWDLQVPIWARSFRVVRFDLPGHGASPLVGATLADFAAAAWQTLDALGLSRAALVGLSLGGMVAQEMAIAAPDRVGALVIAHSGGRTAPAVAELWDERIAAAEAAGVEALVAPTLGRWFTPEFAETSPLQLDWIGALVRATSLAGFRNAARAIQGLDTLDRLGRLAMPALVIGGERDTALPIDAGRAVAAALPRATFASLPTAHLGNIEQPGAFTELVGRFLIDNWQA